MTAQSSALSLAHLVCRTYLRWGGYGALLVIGGKQQQPLVIVSGGDSFLVIDCAKRHALAELLRSSAPVLKTIKRDPRRYGKAFVAFSITADGIIDIEAGAGGFDRVPAVERVSPHEARALYALMNANERPRARPDGLPGVADVRGRL